MTELLIQKLPRYECLLEAARRYPDLNPSAADAYLRLVFAGSRVEASFVDYLQRRRLSRGRFTVLMFLNRGESGPINPAELADCCGVTRATITGLVDGLVRDGLVSRKSVARDRRMAAVEMTPAGRRLIDGVLPGYFRRVTRLMRRLKVSERATLVKLLGKIIEVVPSLDEGEHPVGEVSAGKASVRSKRRRVPTAAGRARDADRKPRKRQKP